MLLVRGGLVLTMEKECPAIRDGAVLVDGSKIVEVGRFDEIAPRYAGVRTLGSEQHWVLPGFVDAHCHAGVVSMPFRQGIPDLPLERWLMRLYNSALLSGEVAVSRLNTLSQNAELIRSGVTCTADFFYGDGSEPYMGAEHSFGAYRQSGLRVAFFLAALDQSSMDNGNMESFFHLMPEDVAKGARAIGPIPYNVSEAEYFRALHRLHRDFHEPDGTIRVAIGPDGPARCSPGFLHSIKRVAKELNVGIQMHLLETKFQREASRREKDMSLVQYLDQLGFLGPETSFAHCVWVSREDMDLLAERGASIVYNPSANLRLFDGIAPVRPAQLRGVNVGIGTDNMGFSDDNDFIDETRLAALLQRVPSIEGHGLSGKAVLEMATINGAKALGLADCIGSLRPGKRADLVTLSTRRMLAPFMSAVQDPEEVFWRRARREDVCDVVINGRLVMEGGELKSVNVDAVNEGLREWFEGVVARKGDREGTVREVLKAVDPVVIKYFGQFEDEDPREKYTYNAC